MQGIARVLYLAVLLEVLICPWRTRVAANETVTLQVGEYLEFAVLDRQVRFIYYFNRTAEAQVRQDH